MSCFDFVMSEIHGLRIKELINEKAAGRAGQSWIDPKRGQLADALRVRPFGVVSPSLFRGHR